MDLKRWKGPIPRVGEFPLYVAVMFFNKYVGLQDRWFELWGENKNLNRGLITAFR